MLARIRMSLQADDDGFTLIELLVVVIIIGILAAIAIPVFLNQRQKATQAGMKSDLRTVANEEESYFVDKRTYVAVTQSGNQVTVTTGYPVKVSDSNTTITSMGVKADGRTSDTTYATGYCLTATNTGVATRWYYNSITGGLTTTACGS